MHWLFLRTIQSGHRLLPFDLPPPCVPVPLCVPSSLISGLRSKHKFDAIDSNQILHLHQTLICHPSPSFIARPPSPLYPPSTFPESHLSPLLCCVIISFSHQFTLSQPIQATPIALSKLGKCNRLRPKKTGDSHQWDRVDHLWVVFIPWGERESVERWPHR